MSRAFAIPRSPAVRSAWAAALIFSAFAASLVRADDEAEPTALAITPQAEPVPALRYRLLPSAAELNPGDAAPIYLRLGLDTPTGEISNTASAWLEEPFDEFSVEEARGFVDGWRSKTEQLSFAAHRSECDWSYPLPEQRERAYDILLPDVNTLRHMSRLLALKARVEMAEGEYDEAIRTIETGMAMARHLADAPFIINGLIGIQVTNQFLDRIEELIGQAEAPNLYWALTALPRPFIDFRNAMENEQTLGKWVEPQIAGPDKPRTVAEWEARLLRLHERLVRLEEGYFRDWGLDDEQIDRIPVPLDAFREAMLPPARTFFDDGEDPSPTSDAELIVRFIASSDRRRRDEFFKLTYLPFNEAARLYPDVDDWDYEGRRVAPEPPSIPWPMVGLVPAVYYAHQAQAKLDRRVAALRGVEAIRMHASANGGSLPETLDAIEVVPVPVDPISGKPFVYRLEGESAILEAPETAMPVASESLPYQITIRE